MKPNDWQDTVAMAASAIEDLLETADEQAGCWVDVPAKLRALTAPPAPAVPDDIDGIIKRFQHQCDHISDWHHIDEHSCKVDRRDLMTVTEFLNTCRAAMLNHVGDANEKAAEKCECSSIDYCENCLRAMLAQPVSGGYKLPDGWIACSERMPELDKRVLLYFGSYDGHIEDGCIGDDGDGPYHYFFDGDSLQQEPTHWMPLPAAPEGGN